MDVFCACPKAVRRLAILIENVLTGLPRNTEEQAITRKSTTTALDTNTFWLVKSPCGHVRAPHLRAVAHLPKSKSIAIFEKIGRLEQDKCQFRKTNFTSGERKTDDTQQMSSQQFILNFKSLPTCVSICTNPAFRNSLSRSGLSIGQRAIQLTALHIMFQLVPCQRYHNSHPTVNSQSRQRAHL